jgi:hypothetical protein
MIKSIMSIVLILAGMFINQFTISLCLTGIGIVFATWYCYTVSGRQYDNYYRRLIHYEGE